MTNSVAEIAGKLTALPGDDRDVVAVIMRAITRAIEDSRGGPDAYGLGGMYGYGTNWSSPVFDMRRYYWGDCDCGQEDTSHGCAPTCSTELPNFRHHATGFEVRWYKYIGRGMEVANPPADLLPILSECVEAVRAALTEDR